MRRAMSVVELLLKDPRVDITLDALHCGGHLVKESKE